MGGSRLCSALGPSPFALGLPPLTCLALGLNLRAGGRGNRGPGPAGQGAHRRDGRVGCVGFQCRGADAQDRGHGAAQQRQEVSSARFALRVAYALCGGVGGVEGGTGRCLLTSIRPRLGRSLIRSSYFRFVSLRCLADCLYPFPPLPLSPTFRCRMIKSEMVYLRPGPVSMIVSQPGAPLHSRMTTSAKVIRAISAAMQQGGEWLRG